MIQGIGCDIVNILRIDTVYQKFGQKFLNRIFTQNELDAAPRNNHTMFMQYLAVRYAAKEAYTKALGTGIGKMIRFKEIEILNNKAGAPYFGNINYSMSQGCKAYLSLSNDYPNAIAFVIIERKSFSMED